MNNRPTPPEPDNALRNLIIILAIVVGFVIYSYGWTITEIDLEEPQEERRQENLGNALRDLLSPRIFEQEREIITISAQFLIDCEQGEPPAQPEPSAGEPIVIVTPTCGSEGDEVTVQVLNFRPNADTRIRWVPPDGRSRPRDVLEIEREEIVTGDDGSFTGTIEVPRISGSEGQIHEIDVRAAIPAGPIKFSGITGQVVRRMIETIFMALIATSVAIPIAALISFFAARNLMRPIRLSVGSLLLAVLALAVGWVILGYVLDPIGTFGLDIGSGEAISSLFAIIVPLFVLSTPAAASRLLSGMNGNGTADTARSIIMKVVTAAVAVFAVGLVGGLALLIGGEILNAADSLGRETIPGWSLAAVGRFLEIIGELIELGIGVIASLTGGFVLASVLGNSLAVPLRRTPAVLSHILGLGMGLASGALVMGLMGRLAISAALLGLLPPLVAGILAGQILVMIYRRVLISQGVHRRRYGTNRVDDTVQLAIFAIGAVTAFILTFEFLNIERALVDGTLPQRETIDFLGIQTFNYVAESAVIGAVLGAVGGALAGVKSNFPMGSVLYNISRTTLNTVRSIEPLIMGLVFVIWVGIGPFAGVLALTLHSIAALGKLYSEQIENIDPGPIEAIQSTGATWLQTVIYAVVPQIVPPYIAFTMYRWDINVRMSTIIGFVGGGGIGLLLQQQINLLRYRDAGVAVLAIAIVVSILDYLSAIIRERLV